MNGKYGWRPHSLGAESNTPSTRQRNGFAGALRTQYKMEQEDINALLAETLDRAETRLTQQEEIIALLVDQIERMSFRIDGALKEAETARLYYAQQRTRLGLSVDLSGGSLIGESFGLPVADD